MVADIFPGASSSFPSHMPNVNGELYFSANDGVHGTELWKSDGTAAGTVMVKDIDPGVNSSSIPNSSSPVDFANTLAHRITKLFKIPSRDRGDPELTEPWLDMALYPALIRREGACLLGGPSPYGTAGNRDTVKGSLSG
jgi:ELWxxDGT repeat protein